jgi:hypothetical protein
VGATYKFLQQKRERARKLIVMINETTPFLNSRKNVVTVICHGIYLFYYF